MYTLETDKLAFSLNQRGLLESLTHVATGHDYAGNGGLWRIIYSRGLELELMASAENSVPAISQQGDSLILEYPTLTEESGATLDVRLVIGVEVIGDELRFSAEISNNAAGVEVRELHFPLITHCNISPGQRLIWSSNTGQRFENVLNFVRSAYTRYMAKDNFEIRRSCLYPGVASTNAFVLENDTEGLYFASYDTSFQFTLHLLGADQHGLNPAMVKYPYIKEGKSWKAENYVLSPYRGSWHVPAEKYKAWASSWFGNRKTNPDIESMNGWQRIIMRHQYGEQHYRYDQLEEICNDGLSAGINTLFMFGWHRDGHDAGYPDYSADESQGGLPALKENVRRLHRAGGKLIVYFNGQLIDMNTPFYREIGKRISVKKADGNEHMEVYAFGGNGTALREFGNKTFVTACPTCPEWLDELKKCVDTAIELEADGVFFDQLGWISRPCYDPSHGHPIPLMNPLKAKSEMLGEIDKYIKERCPSMSLGIEWISDVTARHVDYVHNITGGTDVANDWQGKGEPPRYTSFMQWFSYIFPSVRLSDREIRDDNDIERRVNHALIYGLRSDVEIFRCRKTIATTPHYRQYLKEANRLRDEYRDVILNGEFRDNDYFQSDSNEIIASCFTQGDKLVVMATQSHRENLTFKLKIDGFKLTQTDGLNTWDASTTDGNTYDIELGRHGLVLLLLDKE
ncbi:MAG: hypothetical protein JXR78_01430 [Victivallales bacterium]|nr:hypothetical protein [Victivallales bacterium]